MSMYRPKQQRYGGKRTQIGADTHSVSLRKNSKNIQNRVLLRNSKEIMLFSILSGIYYIFLGFRCVLHNVLLLTVCELNAN